MNLITPDLGLIFWQTVTLLIVLFILGKFAWKPILHIMKERERSVEEALREAEEARELVAQVQVDQERLLEKTNIEREKIIAEAVATKNAILEESKAEAERLGQKLLEQARIVIKEEKEAAFATLKSEVVTLSVQIAEKLLENELKPESKQQELVNSLMKKAYLNRVILR